MFCVYLVSLAKCRTWSISRDCIEMYIRLFFFPQIIVQILYLYFINFFSLVKCGVIFFSLHFFIHMASKLILSWHCFWPSSPLHSFLSSLSTFLFFLIAGISKGTPTETTQWPRSITHHDNPTLQITLKKLNGGTSLRWSQVVQLFPKSRENMGI